MRSRLRWRSLCTMKSSSDRMRKDEMQLTMSLIPLAMESKRLFPSDKHEEREVRTPPLPRSPPHSSLRPFTWVQAGELAALFGVFTEVLTPLRTLAQRCHAHLRLAVMTGAAQARVVPLRREVVALVYHVVLYVHAGLPCQRRGGGLVSAPESGSTEEAMGENVCLLLLQRKGNFLSQFSACQLCSPRSFMLLI